MTNTEVALKDMMEVEIVGTTNLQGHTILIPGDIVTNTGIIVMKTPGRTMTIPVTEKIHVQEMTIDHTDVLMTTLQGGPEQMIHHVVIQTIRGDIMTATNLLQDDTTITQGGVMKTVNL